ncbi:cysteine desulfurase family protein [Deinococcus arenicola]|uniref:cysteine desulfurase n=1 Tax=Deinococcus arenicola TaxID=2994950 RepID=A0ABU4DNZ3_9DEIO|nr:cysteine desulfurase family protein [Deinococcus sp. ZS9-10]MDV6374155.1 cysteine desulfurase family protein [Deinococcus sp. ZS9-10]
MNNIIYLDGFSTTRIAPEALNSMMDVWQTPSNTGSPHILGERSSQLVNQAKVEIASLIGADPTELIITSGATEANNIAILGVCRASIRANPRRNRIVISSIEHKAVSEAALFLEREGFAVDILPVRRDGLIDLEIAKIIIGDTTALVSVMLANNEIGTIQPIKELAAICHDLGSFLHCDAAQAVGKIEIDVFDLDVDYLSISGHKIYGPCGVGVLYIAAGSLLPIPLVFGGGQQRGLRPGTIPVALIVGLGAACKVALNRLAIDAQHGIELRNEFLTLSQKAGLNLETVLNDLEQTIPGSLSIKLNGYDAEDIVRRLSTAICLSTGSACTSGSIQPSHVLSSIGLNMQEASSVLRLFFGRFNDVEEVEITVRKLTEIMKT